MPPKRRGESPEGRSGRESESRAGRGKEEGASQSAGRGRGMPSGGGGREGADGKGPLEPGWSAEGIGVVEAWDSEAFLLRRRKAGAKGLNGGLGPGRGGGRAVLEKSGRRGVLGEEAKRKEGKGRGKPEREGGRAAGRAPQHPSEPGSEADLGDRSCHPSVVVAAPVAVLPSRVRPRLGPVGFLEECCQLASSPGCAAFLVCGDLFAEPSLRSPKQELWRGLLVTCFRAFHC